MGILVMLFEVTVLRTMLCVEVRMPFLMRLAELLVKPTMLPFRHRDLVHGLVGVAQIVVLFTVLGVQVLVPFPMDLVQCLVSFTVLGVQILMPFPMSFIQFPMKPTMLFLCHRTLVHGPMHCVQILVLPLMLSSEILGRRLGALMLFAGKP